MEKQIFIEILESIEPGLFEKWKSKFENDRYLINDYLSPAGDIEKYLRIGDDLAHFFGIRTMTANSSYEEKLYWGRCNYLYKEKVEQYRKEGKLPNE